MNKPWLLTILTISFLFLTLLKAHELRSLKPYFKGEGVIKLKSFENARQKVSREDLDILKLWESILTGRAAPLSRWMKEHYRKLGLNHLFTPSGFHLSAVLMPVLKIVGKKYHLLLLLLLGVGLCFLPGLTALKRMLLIKSHQKLLGLKLGFAVALVMDIFFGTFQSSALSFTYSFLFLGIIYSGVQGLGLIIWFFIAQILLAYFQNADISILLLIFSPILNLGFSILMPLLFILSFPLWDWQLTIGITLLKLIQAVVELFSFLTLNFPLIETNIVLLLIVIFLLTRKLTPIWILTLLFCTSLNLDRERSPGVATNEFVPQGQHLSTYYDEKHVKVKFSDGNCRLKLVRGFWWENCSPSRRGSRQKKLKIKKLSYRSSKT